MKICGKNEKEVRKMEENYINGEKALEMRLLGL